MTLPQAEEAQAAGEDPQGHAEERTIITGLWQLGLALTFTVFRGSIVSWACLVGHCMGWCDRSSLDR